MSGLMGVTPGCGYPACLTEGCTKACGPANVGSMEGLGLVPEHVTPRAWAIFVDSSNARLWSTLQPHVQKLADAEGLAVTALYDHAAIDAAVAAERGRWIAKAGQAYKEAHAMFDDYSDPSNKPVRDCIEWHLWNLRHDEIDA